MSFKFLKQNFLTILIIFSLAILLGVGSANFAKRQISTSQPTTKAEEKVKIISEESVVIDVVRKVAPSVASIAVERRLLNPFEPFEAPRQTQSGIGTGFVISSDGLILTNRHVVDAPGRYFVILKGGDKENKYEVGKIHKDPFNDLAILKIDPPAGGAGFKPLELGDSSKLQVGQKVIAIGNALGRLDNTVTTGVVSGLGRGITPVDPATGIAENIRDVIQTDAAINPGNSGGPLLNTLGQVIGINTAVAGAVENIGFAIPVNVAKDLISDFEKTGRISRPFLGVRYNHISQDVALLNNVPEGEFIQEVVEGTAADKAGLRTGDIIIEFDGVKLTEGKSLQDLIRAKKVGDRITLKIFRDGKTFDLTVTLEEASS